MIGANAVATELAVQLLDAFDLQGWKFTGVTDSVLPSGTAVRVNVTPPKLPDGTGYSVLVSVNDDEKLGDQLKVAADNLVQLLTTAAPYQKGETPDAALEGFFQSMNLPEQVAKEQRERVEDQRHPKQAIQESKAS